MDRNEWLLYIYWATIRNVTGRVMNPPHTKYISWLWMTKTYAMYTIMILIMMSSSHWKMLICKHIMSFYKLIWVCCTIAISLSICQLFAFRRRPGYFVSRLTILSKMIQHNPSSVVTWCQHVLQAFHPWTGIKGIVSVTGMIWKIKWYLTRVVKIGHKVDFMATLPQLGRFLQTDWPTPAPGPKHSYPLRWPSNVSWSQALLLKAGYYRNSIT